MTKFVLECRQHNRVLIFTDGNVSPPENFEHHHSDVTSHFQDQRYNVKRNIAVK